MADAAGDACGISRYQGWRGWKTVLAPVPLLLPVLVGVFGLLLTRTDVWSLPVAEALFLIAILFLLLLRRRELLGVLLIASLWGLGNLFWDAFDMQVDEDWLAKPLVIRASIESVQRFPLYARLRVTHVQRKDGARLAGTLQLYVRKALAGEAYKSFLPGQRIRARVRLHQPRNYLNPGSFDYRAWCFDRHIAALGSVVGDIRIVDGSVSPLEAARHRVRQAIAQAVRSVDGKSGAAGVLSAVLLGDRSQVDRASSDAFAATGTAHLLAISGMHVGMAAAWIFALCWWLLTRRESWIVWLPVRSLSLLAGLTAATAYALLAGWPLPAVRAGIMLAAGVLAWLMASRFRPMNILLAALAWMLLFDPSAIASVSLWLSFLATSGVLIWAESEHQTKRMADEKVRAAETTVGLLAGRVRALFWVSLLAMLVTLPVTVTIFGRVPVYGLPANLMMVPLYGLWVMPLALAGAAAAVLGLDQGAVWLLQGSVWGINQGLSLIGWLADLPFGQLMSIKPERSINGLYLLACVGVVCLLYRRVSGVGIAGLAIGAMAAYGGYACLQRDVAIPVWMVWDVGQGAASSLLLPGGKVMVVDVPGRAGSRFNGGTMVASGLRELGLTHVDVLVLSHAQSDHMGGAASLMDRVNTVGEIWLPDVPSVHQNRRMQILLERAKLRHVSIRWLARGDRISLGEGESNVRVQVLWPPRHARFANTNNTSLVLLSRLGNGVSMLWPADIESMVEATIIQQDVSPVTAMLMPHHGSQTSSSRRFVHALHPSLVVAQTGFANRFGFPKQTVVARYQREGSRIMNTANGAVRVDWVNDSDSYQVKQWHSDMMTRREIALQWWQRHL